MLSLGRLISAISSRGCGQEAKLPNGAGISTTYSPREIAEVLHPNAKTFLQRLGIGEKDFSIFRAMLESDGHIPTFQRIAIGNLIGLYPSQIPQYFRYRDDDDAALRIQTREILAFEGYFGAISEKEGELPLKYPGKDLHLNLFPCNFRAFPCLFARRLPGVELRMANIFAMFLPEDDMVQIRQNLRGSEGTHVANAFAYIRYYQTSSGYMISEIQSDVFSRMSRSLRERYKHWPQAILLAFEHYVGRRSESPFQADLVVREISDFSATRIVLPTSEVVKERWRTFPEASVVRRRKASKQEDDELNRTIGDQLAQRLYEELPAALQYVRGSGSYGFMEVNHYSKTMQGDGWLRDVEETSGLLGQLNDAMGMLCGDGQPRNVFEYMSRLLKGHTQNSGERWVKLQNELFPPEYFADVERGGFRRAWPRQREIIHPKRNSIALVAGDGVEAVPVKLIKPASMLGVSDEMLKHHRELTERPATRALLKAVSSDFAFMSKGSVAPLPEDWWVIPQDHTNLQARALHIREQDRHPVLRCCGSVRVGRTVIGDIRLSVGYKGGGIRSIEGAPISDKEQTAEYRLPIYRNRKTRSPILAQEKGPLIPSHMFWGGLLLSHAQAEYINTLGVSHLLQATGHDPMGVAVPVDICVPESLPKWRNGTARWVNQCEYQKVELGFSMLADKDCLAIFRTISSGDVRIPQLINRIFERTDESSCNLKICKFEIDSALAYLYWLHGFNLEIPRGSIDFQGNSVELSDVAHYLKKVSELNAGNAQVIRRRILERALTTLGLVHGAGGHLGGAYRDFLGAYSGGAIAKRNVDLLGGVHDLDMDVFLPWLKNPAMPYTLLEQNQLRLSEMQWFDLMFWRDLWYWTDTTVLGRDIPRGCDLKHYEVGKYNHVERFGSLEPQVAAGYDSVLPPSTKETGNPIPQVAELLDDPEWHGIYSRTFAEGKEFRVAS